MMAKRWYQDRAAWSFVAFAYVPWLAALQLAWETLQLPLYTVWSDGTPGYLVFSVLHCTAGDVLIGLSALLAALFVLRAGQVPEWRWGRVAAVTVALSVGYTIFSEWLNTRVLRSWAYSEWMPVISIGDVPIGMSPIAQWLLIPPVALFLSRRLMQPN